MRLTFRHAAAGDVQQVLALTERAYRGEYAARGWTNEVAYLGGPRTNEDEIRRLINGADRCFILAFDDQALVGAALIERQGEGAYFGMFSVDPALQAAGIGKALLARCEIDAMELWNAAHLRLTVISLRSELIAWYERRGFFLTGVRLPFPFSETSGEFRSDFDLVEMRKVLGEAP